MDKTASVFLAGDVAGAGKPVHGAGMAVYLHEEDLPEGALGPGAIAVDTETMGLIAGRDRLCVVQLSAMVGRMSIWCAFRRAAIMPRPCCAACWRTRNRLKIYHFGRFDIAMIEASYGRLRPAPVYCTKIASRLVRTYTDRHGLKELVRELLGADTLQAAAVIRLGRACPV
jgi:ribonuclease D